MKTHRGQVGFTFFEAMVVTAILCIGLALALPALTRARSARCCRLHCTNNQKQITLAFKQWALDNNDKFPMAVSTNACGTMEWAARGSVWESFLVISNELNTPKILVCPDERDTNRVVAYTFNSPAPSSYPFTNNNNVSYFVGLDADSSSTNRLLCGDANLALIGNSPRVGLLELPSNSPVRWVQPRPNHGAGGVVGLSDGSVTSCSDRALRQLLRQSGIATNRLAVP
jgi:type II secretory pathway pseudopilin PulG